MCARTSQTNRPDPETLKRQVLAFFDHAGRPAHSIWHGADHSKPPEFSVQVYSTLPLQGELHEVARYLGNGTLLEASPRFDFYAPLPDIFSCVEHQQREIQHRKSQPHVPGAVPHQLAPIPVFRDAEDFSPLARGRGLVAIIVSQTYQDLSVLFEDRDDPDGPMFATFSRFAHEGEVDPASLVYEEEMPPLCEKLEISFERVRRTGQMQEKLASICSVNGLHGHPDFGLYDDYTAPSFGNLSLSSIPRPSTATDHPGLRVENILTEPPGIIVTNTTPSESQPHLRYLVYPTFPGSSEANLSRTARVFTSTLLSHCPAEDNTTCHIEFYQLPAANLQSSITHARAKLATNPAFTLGFTATNTLQDGATSRRYPTDLAGEHRFNTTGRPLYKTFAIVLDREDFLNECGVVYVLADVDYEVAWDGMATEWRGDTVEAVVLRAPGVEMMAGRLCGNVRAEL